jgi:hypothetical protein
MTNEEMERAIDFLLKSQASFETRLERSEASFNARFGQINQQLEQINRQVAATNEQLAETNKHLAQFADTQADMIRVMTSTFEAQAQINKLQQEFRRTVAEDKETQKEINRRVAESQARADRRLDALIDIVRRERNGE